VWETVYGVSEMFEREFFQRQNEILFTKRAKADEIEVGLITADGDKGCRRITGTAGGREERRTIRWMGRNQTNDVSFLSFHSLAVELVSRELFA